MHLLYLPLKHPTRTDKFGLGNKLAEKRLEETWPRRTNRTVTSGETLPVFAGRSWCKLVIRWRIVMLNGARNHRAARNQNVWRRSFDLVTCARSRATYTRLEHGRVRTHGRGSKREGWVWRSAANHRHMPRHGVHEWRADAVYPGRNTWYRDYGVAPRIA